MLYTIVDIETTGLSNDIDNILSFGYIRINSNFEIKSSGVYYFYKPNFEVGKYPACTIHKLKRDFLEQYESEFNNNIKKMYSLCYNSSIIGKNSTKFDMPFIQKFIRRHVPTLDPLEYYKTFDIQDHFSPIYKSLTGSTKKGTLGDYINVLGITDEDIIRVYNSLPNKDGTNLHLHGALYDVIATYLVFKETCTRLNLKP